MQGIGVIADTEGGKARADPQRAGIVELLPGDALRNRVLGEPFRVVFDHFRRHKATGFRLLLEIIRPATEEEIDANAGAGVQKRPSHRLLWRVCCGIIREFDL